VLPIRYNADRWKRLFFTVWSTQALSLFGSRLVGFALIWWLTVESGKASTLAIAGVMISVPRILSGPVVGPLVDRWNRRVVMIAADSTVAISTAFLAVLFLLRIVQPWHIFAILAVRTAGGTVHNSAMLASTSLMVPKDQLNRIAGMNQALAGAIEVAGPILGAVLVELVPIEYILAIDIATAGVAILALACIMIPQIKPKTREKDQGFTRQAVEGFRYLFVRKGLGLLFLYIAMVRLFTIPAWRFLPLLVTQHFGGGAIHLGLISSAFGAGVLLGGLLLTARHGFGRRIFTSWVGLTGCGITFLLVGSANANMYWLALLACGVFGIMFSLYMAPISAIIHTTVPKEIQGRVFSLFNTAKTVTTPLGLALSGFVASFAGIRILFVFAAAGMLLFSLLTILTRPIMNVETQEQDDANH
jgi:MFS transporter, DHA3 family, macrolide efflux protein